MALFKFGGKAGANNTNLPASLKDASQRFKIIIDSIEEGVVLIDSELVVQLINPGAAAICGWPAEDTIGVNAKSLLQLVNEKGEPWPDDPFTELFTKGQNVHVKDAFLVKQDKQQIPISFSLSPVLGPDHAVQAAVAMIKDVSVERQEEKQRADFISTASHEMRTPVAAIEGYLALAMNEKVSTIDTRARGYLEKAHSSTQHLGKLFQDLLTSARAEDGRLASAPKVVEMGGFLEQLSGDLKLVAEKKGLSMDFVTGNSNTIDATKHGSERVIKPFYYVFADADRLREVITNLFDNAVKYTPEGKVSIGLTGNDQVVQCFVKDTGPGIPDADQPHLFQKFYRVDNSATRTIGGNGLGLFICRKIVELYNGRIWVESKLGEGSTFFINLPRLTSQRANQLQIDSSETPGSNQAVTSPEVA